MGFLQFLIREHKADPFPQVITQRMGDLIYVGGDLTVESVISAYSMGCFPWTGEAPIPWYSPDPRLVLLPSAFKASKNLRKLGRNPRYRVVFDTHFSEVIEMCARIPRSGQSGTWITPNMVQVYGELHRRGVAHCVAVLAGKNLVGGLYGLSLGNAFFGESMFSLEANTSKLALYALCTNLEQRGFAFIDCQQVTSHLMSLGAFPIKRTDYLAGLSKAIAVPGLVGSWKSMCFPLSDRGGTGQKPT